MDQTEKTPSSAPSTILIRIKSSNIPSDLTLPVSSSLTVSQLKHSIQQSLGPSANDRYIRLIYSGRLLAPDDAPIDNFKLQDGSVIHVVVAAAGVRGGQQAQLSRPERLREEMRRRMSRRRGGDGGGNGGFNSLRGAGIGEDGLVVSRGGGRGISGDIDHDSEEDEEDLEVGVERRGFDRLRADGLTRGEISALRVYFSSQIDRYMEQQRVLGDSHVAGIRGNNNNGQLDDGHVRDDNDEEDEDMDPEATARSVRLRMEDEWMEAQGPNSEFRLNLNTNNLLIQRRIYMNRRRSTGMDPMYTGPLGTDRDFIWGFVLGYFIGFMMMFWVWIPTVPHRQKLGILTGICFHMGMNIMNGGSLDGEDTTDD